MFAILLSLGMFVANTLKLRWYEKAAASDSYGSEEARKALARQRYLGARIRALP